MKTNRKNNQLLLIAAGALLLAIIGYLFYQNSQLQQKLTLPQPPTAIPLSAETANWKTYTNNDYGFSLKYPQELSLDTSDMSSRIVHYISFISPDGCNFLRSECKKAIRVQILENPKELSLQEFYRTSSDYDIFVSGEGKEITLAGLKAYKFGADDNFARVIAYKNRIFVIQDLSVPIQENNTFDQILQTFQFDELTASQFTEENAEAQPSPKSVIKLVYSLPSDWKTVQDKTGAFEVGYNPTKSAKQLTENLKVEILTKWEDNPARNVGYNFAIGIRSYDGGSRHSFIFPEPRQGWEKSAEYHEKEYIYNGQSCLVLYGTYVSQSNDTWGMCAINSKQAFSFSSNADEKTVEQIIGTIRLLK